MSLVQCLVVHSSKSTGQRVPELIRISFSPERVATHKAGWPTATSGQFRVIHLRPSRPSTALKRSGAVATTLAMATSLSRLELWIACAPTTTSEPAATAVPTAATVTDLAALAAETAALPATTVVPTTVEATPAVALATLAVALTTDAPVSTTAQPEQSAAATTTAANEEICESENAITQLWQWRTYRATQSSILRIPPGFAPAPPGLQWSSNRLDRDLRRAPELTVSAIFLNAFLVAR